MWLDLINTFAFPLRWLSITLMIWYKKDQLQDMIEEYEFVRGSNLVAMHYDDEIFELFQDINSMKSEINRLEWRRRRL